ncbi:MAG: methyltransferase domain-containing protein [Deinococcus sp.]|nr:methyltransferase domain-containing protein [Deinococcus sp.]
MTALARSHPVLSESEAGAGSQLASVLQGIGDIALRDRVRRILAALVPQEEAAVLDCGCGDGFYLHLLAQLGKFRSVGVDCDPAALATAGRNLAGCGQVELIQAEATALPFPAASFDAAICSEVLEHISDDLAALQELHRVLRPGGQLLVTVPHRRYPFWWDPVNRTLEALAGTHVRRGFWAGIWNQHLRLYSRGDLAQAVAAAGFRIERLEGLTHYCLPFNHYFLNAMAILLHRGALPGQVARTVNKFVADGATRRRPGLVALAFALVDQIDRRNQRELPEDVSTVSLFLRAVKEE